MCVCVCFTHCFLLPFPYSHGHALWFCHIFLFFSLFFCHNRGKDDTKGPKTTQYSGHMQQFNHGNEGKNIGGAMGVFSGVPDRSIGQNSSFLDSTVPTQEVNNVAITVAPTALQYATPIYADSLLRTEQIIM